MKPLATIARALFASTFAIATAPSLAQSATNAPEAGNSVFEQLARDPYLKRYGRPAGDGWMPVLETNTDVRFGGLIQLNMIHDFENAGYPYGWFVPALIPVPTDNTPNTEFDARPSRFVFETRTQTQEVGNVSTFISFDFYAVGGGTAAFPEPRLRQAYVTWVGPKSNIAMTVGQSWSTFLDLGVWPEIADLQGPNAMTGSRQGLIRGSRSFGAKKNLVFDLALEQPETAVQNTADAKAITDWPDLVARLNWQQDWGHLQGAVLARQLVAETTAGTGRDSAFGYGLSLSGSWKVPGTRRKSSVADDLGPRQDTIQFQVQSGSGSGRYVFDLSTAETGYDAFYDVTNQTLEPLDQLGWFAAYHHWWTDRLRSAFVYSVEEMDNLAIQPGGSYKKGTYMLANLAYRAFTRMDIALEYTKGERENKDGQTGEANRINLAFNYGF